MLYKYAKIHLRKSSLSLFAGAVMAHLHVRFLSQQLDAIFVALKLQQVSNPYDIAATNRTENRTWFTHAILKLQSKRDKNCIKLLRQNSPVYTGLNGILQKLTYDMRAQQNDTSGEYVYRDVYRIRSHPLGDLHFFIHCAIQKK